MRYDGKLRNESEVFEVLRRVKARRREDGHMAVVQPEFIKTLQGKDFVLYAGLVDAAHKEGLKGIHTEVEQVPTKDNGMYAVVKATATKLKRKRDVEGNFLNEWVELEFDGIGDASPESVSKNIQPHILRMAECAPLSTQILTREGWKTHDQLALGEEVLAYDVPFGATRWVALQGVNVFTDAEVVRMSSRSFDVVCTPDHKWAVGAEGGQYKRRLKPANAFNTMDSIIMAAPAEGGQHPLSIRDAAVLGWLATDGSLKSNMVGPHGPYQRAYIQQSKPELVDEIRELLHDDAKEATESPRIGGRGVTATLTAHRFSLTTEYLRHLLDTSNIGDWGDLKSLVMHLSSGARAAMLDAMLKGDGHMKRGKYRVFGKKRKPGVMEAFEILATLEGVALGRPTLSSLGEVPLRTLRAVPTVKASYLKVLPEEPQNVWCPTTECGTWIMRDTSGTISITGNTRAKGRALRDLTNIGMVTVEELGPDMD